MKLLTSATVADVELRRLICSTSSPHYNLSGIIPVLLKINLKRSLSVLTASQSRVLLTIMCDCKFTYCFYSSCRSLI